MCEIDKAVSIRNTKNAIKFMTQLYTEISHLIAAIDGQMKDHDLKFVYGFTGGGVENISIDSSKSRSQPEQWLYKKMSMFFVEEKFTKIKSALEEKKKTKRTETKFIDGLKIIYIRFVLDGDGVSEEPIIYCSVFYDINPGEAEWIKCFENIMSSLDRYDFLSEEKPYKFNNISFNNIIYKVNMYEISSAEDVMKKVVIPIVEKYNSV